jgi:ribonuclease HI
MKGSSKRGKVYAVAKGKKRGLFDTWDDCRANIKGVSGAVFKKFQSSVDAIKWLDESPCGPTEATADMTTVYTDGACQNNQASGSARAGLGVWFGHDDKRNLSERVPGKQTNQRAELMAVIRALEQAPAEPLHVLSDSEYCVLGINYRLTGWVKDKFDGVENPELWQRVQALLTARKHPVALEHIKGHSGVLGNEAADALAVKAAQDYS